MGAFEIEKDNKNAQKFILEKGIDLLLWVDGIKLQMTVTKQNYWTFIILSVLPLGYTGCGNGLATFYMLENEL